MVEAPNNATPPNIHRPTFRSMGARPTASAVRAAPTPGAVRKTPRPAGPMCRMSLANAGRSAGRATEQHGEQVERNRAQDSGPVQDKPQATEQIGTDAGVQGRQRAHRFDGRHEGDDQNDQPEANTVNNMRSQQVEHATQGWTGNGCYFQQHRVERHRLWKDFGRHQVRSHCL